ncbi:membrane protein [Clostridia bacterium]|nr:membrane protein [Clostridia bacterium]
MEPIDGKEKNYARKKSFSRVFWGILFLVAATAVILNQLGAIGDIKLGLGTVVLGVILLVVLVSSIVNVFWFGIFFSLGFAFWLFRDELAAASGSAQIADMTGWGILGIALLLSIGFTLLFHKRKPCADGRPASAFTGEHFESRVSEADGDEVIDRIHFSSKIRYINTEDFKKAVIDCSFGAVKLFFDNAHIAGGKAVIELNLSFSAAELYIPKNWRLVDNLHRRGTGIEEKNHSILNDDSPIVALSGSSSFSGITIIYV